MGNKASRLNYDDQVGGIELIIIVITIMQTSEKYQRRHRCHHICHRATGHSLHMSQIDSDFGVIRFVYKKE